MAMGTAIWAMAAAGITMVGAEAAITIGDTQLAGSAGRCFLQAALPGGFSVDGCTVFGRNLLFGRALLP